MHRVRATNGLGRSFRETDGLDLAFFDELAQGADRLLDWRGWIDPVLVIEVDVVGAKSLERSLERNPDVFRAAVHCRRIAIAVRDQAELRCQDHIVAATGEGATDQLFIGVRSINLRRVDARDSEGQRSLNL